MSLEIGSRIAHYDVTVLIGDGGMGQVYHQATDTKLNRQVALKVLPEAFAADPDRLARFQREAQVLASLNHPNIAQIHGIEGEGGTWALGSVFGRTYDVAPDGQRFLMIADRDGQDGASASTDIIVIQHWLEELKERVPIE
jgi:serine/threonine protein kinase